MDRLTELISAEEIAERVDEMARDIARDYADKDLLVVGVLKGSFIFLADLLRNVELSPSVDFLRVASYGSEMSPSGAVEFRKDIESPIAGRDVLVVEDIIDTGLTLDYLKRHFEARDPASLRFCALLDKPSRRKIDFKVDYVGFSIDDEFVVGYGLDFNEQYRTLPSVCILQQDADADTPD